MPGSAETSPKQNSPSQRAGNVFPYLLIALIGIAALLQVSLANRSGLWADEIFSIAIATGHSLEHAAADARPEQGDFVEPARPVPAAEFRRYLSPEGKFVRPARVIRAVLLSDTSPPLYYLFLGFWTCLFGTTDLSVRSFSIVCSLACLPLLAGIARRTGGPQAMVPACILFILSPFGAYYSTEARMYSLLWLCLLATILITLRLREQPKLVFKLLWVLSSAAGFLTHYFFLFPWLAIVAFLSWRPAKLPRLHLAGCGLATAILVLPWYLRAPESLARWRITGNWLRLRPEKFNPVSALFELPIQFFSGLARDLWPTSRFVVITTLLLLATVALILLLQARPKILRSPWMLLILTFIAVCGGPILYDLSQHTYTIAVPRYALSALPVACLLLAAALATLHPRARLILLLLILLCWAPSLYRIFRQGSRNFSPLRQISIAATRDSNESDLVLVHSIPSGVLAIARYAAGPADITSWVGQLGTRRMPESLRTMITGRRRVFFVKAHEVDEPAPEEEWLRASSLVANEKRFGSGKLVEFRPKNSNTF